MSNRISDKQVEKIKEAINDLEFDIETIGYLDTETNSEANSLISHAYAFLFFVESIGRGEEHA